MEEKSAFASSAVPVATAIPAFIGFTEKAKRGSKSLLNVPTRITSLGEYHNFFGKGAQAKFNIAENEESGYTLEIDKATAFSLYNSLKLFFNNGGSTCYIVSIGSYSSEVGLAAFTGEESGGGLQSLLKEPEPTLLLSPDAVLLSEEDFNSFQQLMLMHCGNEMKNRMAILDVYNGDQTRTMDDEDIITKFREAIGTNFLDYGTAYYPWLNTTITKASELDYRSIANLDGLIAMLTKDVDAQVSSGKIDESRGNAIKEEIAKATADSENIKNVDNTLLAISPLYKQIIADVRKARNVMPPSGAMAGVFSMVDNSVGIQKAPANVSLGSVVSPTVNITSRIQEDLNLPLNGKAVNAIRSFPGKGVLVWGARTLDGNSQDWRYVNVRRTLIFIEQTIKYAAERYVFEPNIAMTWVKVSSTITGALYNAWRDGVLAGNTAQEAFKVDVGLGSTMTQQDILDGVMRVSVKVAISRPAEFIVITFQQQMAGGEGGGEDEGGEGEEGGE